MSPGDKRSIIHAWLILTQCHLPVLFLRQYKYLTFGTCFQITCTTYNKALSAGFIIYEECLLLHHIYNPLLANPPPSLQSRRLNISSSSVCCFYETLFFHCWGRRTGQINLVSAWNRTTLTGTVAWFVSLFLTQRCKCFSRKYGTTHNIIT